MMPKPITIVAGFGRCGSSLVMQMLAAGGMPTPYASYPSYEINKNQRIMAADLEGGAIKILDLHYHRPPVGPTYRFIWLDRDVNEQAKSMAKFWKAIKKEFNPPLPDFNESQIKKLVQGLKKDRPRCQSLMYSYTQRVLKLKFEDILAYPAGTARKISTFCGGLDEKAMVAQVRERGWKCLPYLMEFELMAGPGRAMVMTDG